MVWSNWASLWPFTKSVTLRKRRFLPDSLNLACFSISAPVCSLAGACLYFGIKLMKAARDRELSLARAEAAKRETELQMLRAQINPHFLFNALNTIRAGVEGVEEEVKDVIHSLAEYLRYSLEHGKRELVPLGKEFEALVSYLRAEKARFRNDLEVVAESTTMHGEWQSRELSFSRS